MIEKPVDIKTSDGVADAEWFCPDEKGQWPGIIMYTDIGGLRPNDRVLVSAAAGGVGQIAVQIAARANPP
jgi:NADPH:quinone reductase-like Zn-dependent oxidoreductase